MKINKFKYILCLFALALVFNCEDDDPISAGNADPLNKTIVSVPVTVSSSAMAIGEGNLAAFDVALGQTFSSDATVTLRIDMDNGRFTTGTVVVPAGSTSASGSIGVSADDGLMPAIIISPNSATVQAIGILLDEAVPDTLFEADSNVLELAVWARTLGIAGGLNCLLDWNGAPGIDLDMEIIDAAFTAFFETAYSGDRFETDLFQTVGRADGSYVIWVTFYDGAGAPLSVDTDIAILLTTPDNKLAEFMFTLPAGMDANVRMPFVQFTKSTNVETGITSYIDFTDVSL